MQTETTTQTSRIRRQLGTLLALSLLFAFSPASLGCSPGTAAVGSGGSGRHIGDTDAGTTLTPAAASETCGNGLDDDRNGEVDDGCACVAGEVQRCFPGDPAKRNRGLCGDGRQTCIQNSAEFSSWGPCIGAVVPVIEIPGNCADEDCDGDATGCGEACGEFEICGNGIDDDCNGFADCADAAAGCECGGPPDDGGGGGCPPGADCACEERCVPGSWRYCDEPVYCAWGRQDCAPDGTWGACSETTNIPAACEGGGIPIPLPIPIPNGFYDPECCVRSGACCQNFGYDDSLHWDENVGNCSGAVETVCAPR